MSQSYAPRGSDLYYVLRKVKREARAAYLALSALFFELSRSSEQYKEVSVAEQKLVWFAEEVERFFAGKSNHPIFKHLEPFREALSKKSMLALIEAHLLNIKTHIFETRSELLQHYQHLGGIAFALKASILMKDVPQTEAHELGLIDELLRHLLHFRVFLNRQHLYFAMEDFQKLGIDPNPIMQFKNLESLKPLFSQYFVLTKSKQKLGGTTQALKPLKLEILLKLKQAEAMEKDGWQFFRHQVELSPIRKLLLTAI